MTKEFPLAIVIRTIDKTTAGFSKVMGNMGKISEKLDKVGRKATTSVTLPILGIGVAAIKAGADFEKGMNNVATLVDTSTESMSDMSQRVKEIARRTPVTFNELTEGLYSTRSAGIAAGDAMEVLEQSARLGVAGLSSTGEAVDIVTSTMNAFKLKGDEAKGVYDVLFTAVKHGKTDLSQLGQGFGAVAGKIADAGIKFDEYAASVSALTTVGLPAAQAHTQMRAALDGLTKSSPGLSKVFKKLGTKDFKSLIQESGGVVNAMMKVREAVGGSEAKMRKLIGSSEGSAAVMSVTGQTNKAFTETLEDMRDGISEVDKGFEKQSNGTAAKWQIAKNSLTSAAISLGTVLAPAVTKVSEKVQELAAWFEGLNSETKETIVKVAAVAAIVGPSILVFGKLAGAIGGIATAVRLVSKAILANPLGVLIGGLIAIKELTGDSWTTLFSDAINFWTEEFGEFFQWLSDAIKDAADEFRRFTIGGIGEKGGAMDQARSQLKTDESVDSMLEQDTRAAIKLAQAMEAERASDRRWADLQHQQNGGFFDATAPPSGTKSHVMIELVGDTSKARVRSIKSDDMIDVKTGNQGG
jgi:TP901 family phage tail tape measure protein